MTKAGSTVEVENKIPTVRTTKNSLSASEKATPRMDPVAPVPAVKTGVKRVIAQDGVRGSKKTKSSVETQSCGKKRARTEDPKAGGLETSNDKVAKRRFKRPENRKMLIRDLPKQMAKYLHPAYARVLTGHRRRWVSMPKHNREALQILKKYKKPKVPRRFPFLCLRCFMRTCTFSLIKGHSCQKLDRRKLKRMRQELYFGKYDDSKWNKLATEQVKNWKSNSLCALEQAFNPDAIDFFTTNIIKESNVVEVIEHAPDSPENEKNLIHVPQIFLPISKVFHPANDILPETNYKQPPGELVDGVLCYHCKALFIHYSQYNMHLYNGPCSKILPSYQHITREDKTGLFPDNLKYSVARVAPDTRDRSRIVCTLCKRSGFKGSGELYEHIVACAKTKKSKEQPGLVSAGRIVQCSPSTTVSSSTDISSSTVTSSLIKSMSLTKISSLPSTSSSTKALSLIQASACTKPSSYTKRCSSTKASSSTETSSSTKASSSAKIPSTSEISSSPPARRRSQRLRN
ncbi:unnamed protein product [Caenorhabditis sp. 36 PRJEB53466]|nr:unnamed protein product [Caenorhabditis sp. 36 PRJEB53466]